MEENEYHNNNEEKSPNSKSDENINEKNFNQIQLQISFH